jgi:hypothetical protein
MTEPPYDDLKALFINCTLKRSPAPSNTAGLIEVSTRIMDLAGGRICATWGWCCLRTGELLPDNARGAHRRIVTLAGLIGRLDQRSHVIAMHPPPEVVRGSE